MGNRSRKTNPSENDESRLRVAIDAQLSGSGTAGGVEQAVAGLVYGLGQLSDGNEEYVVICAPGKQAWLSGLVGPNTRLIERPLSPVDRTALRLARTRILQPVIPTARLVWRSSVLRLRDLRRERQQGRIARRDSVHPGSGIYERIGAHVVHFPYQKIDRTNVPTIFTPWDFQHEYHPEFFSEESLMRRRRFYPSACQHASAVVAGTPHVRQDICQYAGIRPEKVFIAPWGNPIEYAPTPTEERLREIAARYDLPGQFALYPAQTFPHKNHIRLLQALAYLRDQRGLCVNLVCTGGKNDYFIEIQHELLRLGLQDQVQFVGFVDDASLRALYRLATFVVFPSLFEGWGFPPVEALGEGVALACSRIEPLSERLGDAALLFDPTSVEAIAEAVGTLTTNSDLRARLIKRGHQSHEPRSWDLCARSHRALYRLLGGIQLTDQDRALLTAAQPQSVWSTENQGTGQVDQAIAKAS